AFNIRSQVSSIVTCPSRRPTSRIACARSGVQALARAYRRTGRSALTGCAGTSGIPSGRAGSRRSPRRAPAVIVQRMVDARAAGVAFSADPVSGRRGIAVVSGLPGLGSALVSGEAEADTWLVDRRGDIVERRIVPKPRIHRADGTHPEGVRRVDVEG